MLTPMSAQDLLTKYAEGERLFSFHDFTGADLHNAKLDGCIFGGTVFKGANLEGASLTETNLIETDFQEANLKNANLSPSSMVQADLYHADLEGANLYNVQLRDSCLVSANLTRADLTFAGLDGALIGDTNFSDTTLAFVDFSKVTYATVTKELAQSLSLPSSYVGTFLANKIELETLKKTANIFKLIKENKHIATKLVGEKEIEIILENINVLYDFFKYSQINEDLIKLFEKWCRSSSEKYYSVFISYSTKDENFVSLLYSRLVNEDITTWFASENMRGGKTILDQILLAIRSHEKILFVISDSSINSNWVKTEIAEVLKRELDTQERHLFPIRIIDYEAIRQWELFDADVGTDLARNIRSYYIPDFSKWKDEEHFNKAFKRLLEAITKDSSETI